MYRGKKWPALQGAVVFGDITSGRIFYAKMADLIAATDGDPTTLATYTEIKTDLPQLAMARAKTRVPATTLARPAWAIPRPSTATPPAALSPATMTLPGTTPASLGAPAGSPIRAPRIDLRLATDSQGEIYLMTKSDGVIRRIESIE